MIKCGVIPSNGLLAAVIRRLDLDADAKLNLREFIDGVRPIENFSAVSNKKVSTAKRPKTAYGAHLARSAMAGKTIDVYRADEE